MSLKHFLKNNKVERKNQFYCVSQAFKDDDGNGIAWEFKPITTKEHEQIREECTIDVPVPGKGNMYKPKLNFTKYSAKLITHCVVFPNLHDKELQDSYGVMSAEELVLEMIDNPSEYNALVEFITRFNGFDESFKDKVDKAKN